MLQSEHAVRGAIRTDTQCARIPESRDGRDIEGHVQKHKRSGLQRRLRHQHIAQRKRAHAAYHLRVRMSTATASQHTCASTNEAPHGLVEPDGAIGTNRSSEPQECSMIAFVTTLNHVLIASAAGPSTGAALVLPVAPVHCCSCYDHSHHHPHHLEKGLGWMVWNTTSRGCTTNRTTKRHLLRRRRRRHHRSCRRSYRRSCRHTTSRGKRTSPGHCCSSHLRRTPRPCLRWCCLRSCCRLGCLACCHLRGQMRHGCGRQIGCPGQHRLDTRNHSMRNRRQQQQQRAPPAHHVPPLAYASRPPYCDWS